MIWSFLISSLMAFNPCQDIVAVAPDYGALETKIENKISESSNLSTIAEEADSILSKLIVAKSPILLAWLKKRDLISAKEDVIARQWRQYYLSEFVLSRYPTKNSQINSSVENLFLEINNMSFDDKYKARLEKILAQVKTDAKAMVVKWPLELSDRQRLIHKIDTLKLYWFEKLEGSRYQNKPLEFVRWGIAYDPPQNEINVGVHAKKYPTDANLYAVLAHEMGHAFDSCRWSSYMKTESPFKNVNECLRSAESVGAKTRDDAKMSEALAKKLLTKEMAQSLQQNPTCNRSFYPPEGTQKDQLSEAFADWFAAELFVQSTYKEQHPRPDLCDNKSLMEGSSYLSNQDRLLRLYFVQPALANQNKFKPKAKYCALPPKSA